MKNGLRIHIIALGYLGERAYKPVILYKADKVYLLRYQNEKDKNALKALKDIKNNLKKNKIHLNEEFCNIFDMIEIVQKLKEIIDKEKENHIFLNISSGNTITSTAFSLISMMYKDVAHHIKPYYAKYDYQNRKIDLSSIQSLPVFHIRCPNKEQKEIILLLKENPEGLRKTEILKKIDPRYIGESREYKSKKLMSLNRRIIEKLDYEWSMIKIEGKRKGAIVKLNEDGKEFSNFI